MGKINLLVANAGNTFTDNEITLFQRAVNAAEEYLTAHFEFDYTVDAVLTAPSFLIPTIPEDGIGARTYNSRFIVFVIDPRQARLTEDIAFESLCHEMSHSLRWEKLPEHGTTLFHDMILEGLAVALEEKALADTNREQQQYFLTQMQTTSDTMIKNIIAELESKLHSGDYDYLKTFFTGDNSLPRWAGYRVGYYLVKKYLEQTSTTIEQATLASYGSFKDICKQLDEQS